MKGPTKQLSAGPGTYVLLGVITLISIFPVTNQTVFQTNLTMKDEPYLKLETDKNLLPKEGTPVKLIIEVPAGK